MIKEKELVNKSDIFWFIDNSDLEKKIETFAAIAELKADQDKIAKLQVFDSSFLRSKSSFKIDGTEIYLLFQPV